MTHPTCSKIHVREIGVATTTNGPCRGAKSLVGLVEYSQRHTIQWGMLNGGHLTQLRCGHCEDGPTSGGLCKCRDRQFGLLRCTGGRRRSDKLIASRYVPMGKFLFDPIVVIHQLTLATKEADGAGRGSRVE